MKILTLFAVLILTSLLPFHVVAQDTTLMAPVIEENTQPELPVGDDSTEQPSSQSPAVSEETQTSFVNGAIVGVITGLIVGGVFTWFLKDKII